MRFLLFFIFLLTTYTTTIFAEDTRHLNIHFKDLDGKRITLAELKGKPILLEFWASWCIACTMSFPHINRIAEKYKNQIHIIGINTDIEDESEIKEIIAENNIKFPVWINHPEGNFYFGGISSLPTFVILDKNGKIVKKVVGTKKDTESELDTLLKKLLRSN